MFDRLFGGGGAMECADLDSNSRARTRAAPTLQPSFVRRAALHADGTCSKKSFAALLRAGGEPRSSSRC